MDIVLLSFRFPIVTTIVSGKCSKLAILFFVKTDPENALHWFLCCCVLDDMIIIFLQWFGSDFRWWIVPKIWFLLFFFHNCVSWHSGYGELYISLVFPTCLGLMVWMMYLKVLWILKECTYVVYMMLVDLFVVALCLELIFQGNL